MEGDRLIKSGRLKKLIKEWKIIFALLVSVCLCLLKSKKKTPFPYFNLKCSYAQYALRAVLIYAFRSSTQRTYFMGENLLHLQSLTIRTKMPCFCWFPNENYITWWLQVGNEILTMAATYKNPLICKFRSWLRGSSMLQNIWLSKIVWDDKLNEEVMKK